MKRFLLLLFCFVFSTSYLLATHNIAGDITVRSVCSPTGNYLVYEVKISTYTNSLSAADRCDLEIFGATTLRLLHLVLIILLMLHLVSLQGMVTFNSARLPNYYSKFLCRNTYLPWSWNLPTICKRP